MPGTTIIGTREVAARLGVSEETVRRLVAAGVLPAIRYSSRARLRFNAEDVTSFLRSTRIEGDGSRALAGAPDGDPNGQSSAVARRATRTEAA